MYKLVERLSNVSSFEPKQNKVLFLTNSSHSERSIFLDSECIFDTNVCCFVYNTKENLIFGTWDNRIFLYKDNLLSLLCEGYSLSERGIDENTIILSKRISKGVYSTFTFNIESRSLSNEIFRFPIVASHEFQIFISDRNTILLTSTSSEFNEWETDLTEYCKYTLPDKEVQGIIRKVFGGPNNKLWVWTDNSQLLTLDISTGTVLSRYRIPELDPRMTNYGFLFPYFDEKKGVVAFLEHRFYIEFDLDTEKLSLFKSFDTGHSDTDWNFSINTFTNDYVYFTARRGPDRSSPSHLGVFNRHTLEVEWGHDLELWITDPYCFLNQAPQYAANKLYALDSKGTLHIYERQQE